MPSSHSANALALMTWAVVETVFDGENEQDTVVLEVDEGWLKKQWRNPAIRKSIIVFLTFFLLGPVPYSRVYLKYHTVLQVVCCVCGMLN